MRFLVLGGGGFIGSSLLPHLLRRGDVTVFDQVPPCSETGNFLLDTIDFRQGAFTEETDFEALVRDADVVFHLISTTHAGSRVAYGQEVRENILPTLALLEACAKKEVEKFVFLSSGGTVYGRGAGKPFCEEDGLYPINPYGVQKACIEHYVGLYAAQRGLRAKIIRPSNPYGPLQNPMGGQGAVAAFCHAAVQGRPIQVFGDGSVVRDYLYIDDLCRGILRIAGDDEPQPVFNLGTGAGHTLREVIVCIEGALGRPVAVDYGPKRDTDVPYSVLDISRYRALDATGGEKPFVPLAEGVAKLVQYYAEKEK